MRSEEAGKSLATDRAFREAGSKCEGKARKRLYERAQRIIPAGGFMAPGWKVE